MYNNNKKNKNMKKLALNLKSNNNNNTNNNAINNSILPPPTPLNYNSTMKNDVMHQQTNDIYKQGPACILPNLYLGAYYNASDASQLNQLNINCIINVASEVNITTKLEYHHVHWTHCQNNLATTEFAKAITKIELAIKKGQTILVHCQQGIERSAALIIAYILHLSRQQQIVGIINNYSQLQQRETSIEGQNWSLDYALKYVQGKAPGIRPNMELLYQLREYDKLSTTTATQAKKHNIQTRTRRSESIASCSNNNNSNNKLISSVSTLKPSTSSSSLKCQNRPRSASLKESSLSSLTQQKQKIDITITPPLCRQKLATAVLLVVLTTAILYQQKKLLLRSFHQGIGEEDSIQQQQQRYHYADSYFTKPVSIY